MELFRGIIISRNQKLVHELERALARIDAFVLGRTIPYYPDPAELERVLHAQAPSIVFVDLDEPRRATETAAAINKLAFGAQVVAVCREATSDMLRTALRAGMREILSTPLDFQEVKTALERLFEIVRENPPLLAYTQHLFSFLPSKPGAGASTLALHIAAALASRKERRVTLMDFDLDCGAIDFMLKLPFGHGLLDAAEHAQQMDESMWMRMASKVGNLDVMRSGSPRVGAQISGTQSRHLVDYARRNYDMVCLDLPGTMDHCATEVLQQSNQIFLVCTPEVASLHMARRRMDFLNQMKLGDRVRVVLNRREKNCPLNNDQIRKLVGVELFTTIPNDYLAAQRAVMRGTVADPRSALGRSLMHLAERIVTPNSPEPAPEKKKPLFSFLGVIYRPKQSKQLKQLAAAAAEPCTALMRLGPRSVMP